MKNHIPSEEQLRSLREHGAWFHAEVEQGMREADDPSVKRVPQEEVSAKWRRRRAELVRQTGGKAE